MVEVLLSGGVLFWFLVATFILGEIVWIERESGTAATLTLIAFVVLAEWLWPLRITHWVVAHPGVVILAIITYFVAGTCWSVVKWYLYVRSKARQAHELALQYSYSRKFEIPQVAAHKATILMWMSYWPFSVAWTVVNDPVRVAFRAIYNHIAEFMQDIADRAFKNIVNPPK